VSEAERKTPGQVLYENVEVYRTGHISVPYSALSAEHRQWWERTYEMVRERNRPASLVDVATRAVECSSEARIEVPADAPFEARKILAGGGRELENTRFFAFIIGFAAGVREEGKARDAQPVRPDKPRTTHTISVDTSDAQKALDDLITRADKLVALLREADELMAKMGRK